MYELIVGNVGSVIPPRKSLSPKEAKREFDEWVQISKTNLGHRAFEEPVVLFYNGDQIEAEYFPEGYKVQ